MSWDKWPFYPLNLTQVIDPEEAEVKDLISLIVSGSSAKFQRALAIIETEYTPDPYGNSDITKTIFRPVFRPVNPYEHFADFCKMLRKAESFDKECENCDKGITLSFIGGFLFSISNGFRENLGKGILTDELRQEFSKRGLVITGSATVDPLKQDSNICFINDGIWKYNIRERDNKLNIYLTKPLERLYRYKCIHGLIEYAYPIIVCGRIIAVAYIGQFLVARDENNIQKLVNAALRDPEVANKYKQEEIREWVVALRTEDEYFKEQTENNENKITRQWSKVFDVVNVSSYGKFEIWQKDNLIDGNKCETPSVADILGTTVRQLSQIVESQFSLRKRDRESIFFGELRNLFPNDALPSRDDVKKISKKSLEKIKEFWGVEWAILFCSPKQYISKPANMGLLEVFVSTGISEDIIKRIMHFNWHKAEFTDVNENTSEPLIFENSDDNKRLLKRGLRGQQMDDLFSASILFPMFLSANYRAVLLVGPFEKDRNIQLHNETDWLQNIADLIASRTLSQLEMIDMDDDLEKWNMITGILIHTFRRTLLPIKVGLGIIQSYLDKDKNYDDQDAKESLSSIHIATEKIAGDVASISVIAGLVEDQYQFQEANLSDIAKECKSIYQTLASEFGNNIIIEDNINQLPLIEMDVQAISRVMGEIIDNAIKYCHDGTYILIGGRQLDGFVEIYIDDFGLGINNEDIDRIFNMRFQGARSEKAIGEEGTGFGLYYAKTVATIHGGTIRAECYTGQRDECSRSLEGFRVIITMKLPVNQPKE